MIERYTTNAMDFFLILRVWTWKAVALFLLIHYLLSLQLFVFSPCFVMQYFVSFLVLQSSRREREGGLVNLIVS